MQFRDIYELAMRVTDKYLARREDESVLEYAARIGTLNQPDRKAQYAGDEWATPEKLREAINTIGDSHRRTQREMMNLKLRNQVLAAMAGGLVVSIGQALMSYLHR